MQSIIDDRRKQTGKHAESDLISIMIESEFFQGNDEQIIDEIVTFFLAGMKTIQITSTNLIYYLTKHQHYKEKLLKEIMPVVEKVKDNIIDKLDYDTVNEFEYLQMCFSESLRIEPPVLNSTSQTVTKDTEVSYGKGKTIIIREGT